MSGRPAVFFDRDGTLMEEVQYCSDPANVHVYAGVPDALRRLKAAGFVTVVITNQAGIGRSLFTEEQYHAVQAEFLRQAGEGLIDATYYCADPPGVASNRRKPEPGMVLEAAKEHSLDLERSFFIGDKSADIECGRRAGTHTIQVLTGYGSAQQAGADFTTADVIQAISLVLAANGPDK
jgi:D-glycero-D-manno-heptose 1,7-bisphosphate phosphatase